jgi:two-component system, NtrC family, response regulator AtoC
MAQDGTSRRVLVVEDELLIRWSIQETLSRVGYTVVEAPNGAAAIRLATHSATTPFDAILLDFRLPDSSDLQLLATLRRLIPESPVILMTAYGTPEIFEEARRLGVCRILDKPFDIHELPDIVQNARLLS